MTGRSSSTPSRSRFVSRHYRPFDPQRPPDLDLDRYARTSLEQRPRPARWRPAPGLGALAFEPAPAQPATAPSPLNWVAPHADLNPAPGPWPTAAMPPPPDPAPGAPAPPRDFDVLYQTPSGLPLVVLRRLGQGGAVLIGDSYFLGNDNLENLNYYRKGNILFLRHLFTTLRAGS